MLGEVTNVYVFLIELGSLLLYCYRVFGVRPVSYTHLRLMVTIVFVSCIEFISYIIDSEPVASMVTI